MHNPNFRVLGAYALVARLNPGLVPAAYQRISELDVDALEMPLAEFNAQVTSVLAAQPVTQTPSPAQPPTATQLPNQAAFGALDTGLDVVVTCIPTVMQSLGRNLNYGLASLDESGRQQAIADVIEVLSNGDRLAQQEQRARLKAIQIHSAPRVGNSSLQALETSLSYLVAHAGSVNLAIEHCDALRPGHPFEKGFLELADEIEVIQQLNSDQLGVTINWGRSAIEARSSVSPKPTRPAYRNALTAYVTNQVELAAASGVLKGLMFSGAADVSGPWGPAFEDSHIAPCGEVPALAQSHASIMDAQAVTDALKAAGPAEMLWYSGAKVTVLDAENSVDRCLAVARATLDLLG